MYDPRKKKSTRIIIAIFTIILLVLYAIEVYYSFLFFKKVFPWCLPAEGISKIYATMSLCQIVVSGLGALFSLISFIQCCCKNSSGCCGPSVFPNFVFYMTIFVLIVSIIPVICIKIKYVYRSEDKKVKDPNDCSGILLSAKEYWYNWAGLNDYRLKDVNEWWDNIVWDEYCKKATTPYLIIAIVGFVVSIFASVAHYECCCFHNNNNDLSQNEDEVESTKSKNDNPEQPNQNDDGTIYF